MITYLHFNPSYSPHETGLRRARQDYNPGELWEDLFRAEKASDTTPCYLGPQTS